MAEDAFAGFLNQQVGVLYILYNYSYNLDFNILAIVLPSDNKYFLKSSFKW